MDKPAEFSLNWVIARIGDFTDDAILITEAEPVNLPGPRIVWCNRAFTCMTGYSLSEVEDKTPRLLQGPATDRKALDTIRRALERWQKVRVELTNYRKDGTPFRIDLGIHPVADETGWFRYWVAIQREMPMLSEREERLHQSLQVADGAPYALGLLGQDGQLTFANQYLRRIVYGDELAPGLPFPYEAWLRRGMAGGDRADWVRRHMAGLSAPPFRLEQRVNGRWHEFWRIHVSDGDDLLIGEEIEDRMTLQQQLRHVAKLDAMGQLTSGVAHDFNNILAVILGNVELLELGDGEPEEQATYIRDTIRAVTRGRSLTQSLLSFARKSHMSPEPVALADLIDETVEMFSRTSATGLRFKVTVEPDLPLVYVDEGLLQHAILNLLINARDAMPSGGEVEVSAGIDADVNLPSTVDAGEAVKAVCMTIADLGTGMTCDVVSRAVEPFFTTKQAGSGLGLSMVHGFVQQSGGRFGIESEPGSGTRVSIWLPGETSLGRKTPMPPPERNGLTGCRILLAEDEQAIRRLLVRILERAGAQVHAVASGDAACGIDREWGDFDILITDLVMPGATQGDDLARLFVDAHPGKPVLLLSGNPSVLSGEGSGGQAMDFGIGRNSAALIKPVERKTLIDTVLGLLEQTARGV